MTKVVSLRAARLLIGATVFSAFAETIPAALGQSQSGFTYNGINLTSYQANEYLSSNEAASTIHSTGANYAAVMETQYMQTSTSNVIAPETASSPGYDSSKDPLSPTDAAVVSAIKSLQAQGLTVSLKPQVDSLDGIYRGSFAPTDVAAWFSSYQTFILHYAEIASQNGVGILVIGTELASLSKSTYKSSWETIITQLRTQYPDLTLAYAANATGAGDEFTTVSFWSDIDIIGVDGYVPLTDQINPTVSQLVAAWTNNKNGFNAVAAFKSLQSTYGKPLIFTEIGYVSVAGTNEEPYASLSGSYDGTEQEDCYEAFFEVFSQETSWMKGVFWWDWNVSSPQANDIGYSSQTKPAGTVTLPKWFGSTTAGFTIAASNPTLVIGQGLNATETIAVTAQGSFAGAVTLTAAGLPSGVTGAFSAGSAPGTQVLTLTAASSAATVGSVIVTVTGTSGSQAATTTVALTIGNPMAQTITFANPGGQKVGTQLNLTATASSGLPVSFASTTTSVCTVNASAIASLLAQGTCTIAASQAGNGTYAAAPTVTDSFQVTALSAVPIPADGEVVVSQLNWRALLGGYADAAGNPAGSSFAVNSSGDIVVANSNDIVLVDAQTGVSTTLGAWASASALTIDSKNNIYVGNPYGPVNLIVELPFVGGTANGGYAPFTTPTASLPVCVAAGITECALPNNLGAVNPGSMAFDANGDLFYATAGDGAGGGNTIYECNQACIGGAGTPIEVYVEPTASSTPSSSSGQLLAGSLAFDSAGNLFFTDSSIYVDTSTFTITSFYSELNELPASTGAGYGGVLTGYAASPTVLYTVTPSPVGTFDNQLDGVAVSRSTNGDTVYFADQNDGIFAFPDSSGGIPLANGQPTALYMVSTQGAKTLTLDGQSNLYLAAYSSVFGSGGDTLGQVTVEAVTVAASPTGTAVNPSATLSPVTTILNDTSCSGTPAPAVSFMGTSTTATATASTSGSCVPTLSGASSFATSVSFTPTVAGSDSIFLTGTDQANNTGIVTVSGAGSGFTLSPSSTSLSVAQGSSSTDTVLVTDENGFSGNVTLATSGLPSGVTASFATNPATDSSVLTLTASSTAIIGGPATVTISGTSGSSTASTALGLTVNPAPSFALTPASPTIAVTQGGNNTENIAVSAANGLTGGVTFAASGLPSGVTAAFSPNPTTTGSSVLTLSASSTAVPGGPATVTITGTSGSLVETTTIALTVNTAPGFTLSSSPATLTLLQGASATSTISVMDAGGFSGAVTLAATGLPTGVTAAFATNPATGSSVLTLTAGSGATTGAAMVTITGSSDTLTATTTISLTVSAPPSFTIAPMSSSVSLTQGSSSTDTVSVMAANGFSGNVTLAASGLPSGVTAAFAANPTTGSSTLTLSALGTAMAGGPVTVTITGTSGLLTASTTIALTIAVPPGFTISATPVNVSVAQGGTVTSTISTANLGGFSGSVALSASGLPSGVNATFAAGASGAQVLTLTASSTATVGGPVTVTINGSSGALTASITIAVTITAAPAFTLSGSAITVEPGATSGNTATISVTPSNGFSGTVNLSCSISPSASSDPAACSLSPSSVNLSGTTAESSTLTVATTAPSTAENRSLQLIWPSGGGTILALMFLRRVAGRRRNWLNLLGCLIVVAVLSFGLSGCGGSSTGSGGTTGGTSPGTYTITVTGAAGSTSVTSTSTLTVQ